MSDRAARPRRPLSHRTRGVVASCLLLVPLLAACSSGPVELADGADLSAADRTACERFLADVPTTIDGEDAREVTPSDAPGLAWGDPAITLTCGAPMPDGFNPFSNCIEVNGIGWYVPPEEADGSVDATFTAIGYRPIVALHIPKDYAPEGAAAALVELAEPVRDGLAVERRCK